jgi:uncharacterized membrane protein
VFVDVARALAVLFMIFGHSLNVFLDPVYQQSLAFDLLLFLRGLTSCMFLFLSGFAFTVASSHYWDAHLRVSRRMLARLRRFAFFVALGYLMRFPARRLEHLRFVGPDGWQAFLIVDILQCIGVTLIGLQLLVLVTRTRRRFAIASAALATAAVLLTPFAWTTDWRALVPLGVAAYLSPATGSLFPLLPWAAFPLLGAALGHVYTAAWVHDPAQFSRRVLLPGGLAMVASGVAFALTPFEPFGPTDFWYTSPNLFLVRAGLVLILLDLVSFLTRWAHHLPRVVAALAQESLLVYFIHILVLYGSAWTPGLRHLLPVPLGPGLTLVWVAIVLASMSLIGWGWNWTKRRHRWVARIVKAGVLGVLLYRVWW